ncbi:DUF3261 domain-containing protein [Capnocytophaga leadbetteri]|uniref:DUF3261 domain-containing protein n=1 Tax=Capnocytophaga leadbetteri TaxID=327575 RepID=UPI0028EFDB1C|nr:DUF3261 domain-containing protein [Capnocytophaga leadbetteri]
MKRILKYSLLLLVGCSTPYQLPSQYQLAPKTTETVKNPHFSVGEQYLYRATITTYGHTFSGLLAAKITADNAWRVALTTDFGNTLFDFEKKEGRVEVNYALPDLNRKVIINTLIADFQKLLQTHFVVIQKYAEGTTEVQQCSVGSDTVYLFTSGTNLSKQLNMKAKSLYTTFTYTPDNITIEHHTLKIQIVLEPIHNY